MSVWRCTRADISEMAAEAVFNLHCESRPAQSLGRDTSCPKSQERPKFMYVWRCTHADTSDSAAEVVVLANNTSSIWSDPKPEGLVVSSRRQSEVANTAHELVTCHATTSRPHGCRSHWRLGFIAHDMVPTGGRQARPRRHQPSRATEMMASKNDRSAPSFARMAPLRSSAGRALQPGILRSSSRTTRGCVHIGAKCSEGPVLASSIMAFIVRTKSCSASKFSSRRARHVSAIVPSRSFFRAGTCSWLLETRSATSCTECTSPVPTLMAVPWTPLW
mmetsp:Transcript_135325/g.432646  ORF Transcript_135325/g.432646 Transcript_135325/m.432646 type:complete len:276 (+) Transcript_135325:286-1113(+)